jgi:hypothetical protein
MGRSLTKNGGHVPRGQVSEVGDKREAANGYHYTKTADRGWVLDHWLIWEEANGRKIDPAVEQVRFLDGNKHNLLASNIIVVPKGTGRLRRREAQIVATILEKQAELAYVRKLLAQATASNDS